VPVLDRTPLAVEARQMQALSLAVHIPIVCMGIAFPAMILFVEGLYLRTHDPTYKALAKRWSKVALVIFAVGVITGTILSFEFGLLWPEFMATFGEVFGVAFGLEGSSRRSSSRSTCTAGGGSRRARTSSPACRS
jgi:cytochrome d ubiquinol oxidase subunit I